jgi:hypothetical protein
MLNLDQFKENLKAILAHRERERIQANGAGLP